MSDTKHTPCREEGPSREALVRRGILPRPEFQVCGDCGMPSACRSARHCGKKDTNPQTPSAKSGMLGRPSGDWPFHQLAAARRAEFEKVDADVATWKQQAETMWCDATNSREPADLQALRQHLDRVVAVRT